MAFYWKEKRNECIDQFSVMNKKSYCPQKNRVIFALKTNISSGNECLSHINSYFCVKSAILNLNRVKLQKRTNKEYRRQSQRNNRIGSERMTMNDNEWQLLELKWKISSWDKDQYSNDKGINLEWQHYKNKILIKNFKIYTTWPPS